MGELRALGRAGRAGRVEDDRRVAVGAVGDLIDGLGAAEELLELARLDEDALGAGRLAALASRVAHLVPAEHELGAGVLHLEADLATLEQRVHRHGHGAHALDPEEDEREVREVGQHHPHPVARLDSPRRQQARHAGARLLHDRIGQLEVVELERDPLAVLGDGLREHVGQVRHRPRVTLTGLVALLEADGDPFAPVATGGLGEALQRCLVRGLELASQRARPQAPAQDDVHLHGQQHQMGRR